MKKKILTQINQRSISTKLRTALHDDCQYGSAA